MKNIILCLSLFFSLLGTFAYSQNGLNCIVVEKYYVSDMNDSIANDGVATASGRLPSGSVTWRIYVDMLAGYKFEAAYGSSTHTLNIATTTFFFNNEDRGDGTPTYTKAQAAHNTVMLDSWLSAGAACVGNFGILKSLDDGIATVVNADGVLRNNDASAGIPLTVQDGLISETGTGRSPGSLTAVGFDPTSTNFVFGSTNNSGNSFTIDGTGGGGAWACLSGAKGPDTVNNNKVLIAQLTTTGVLSFQLNIQIGDSLGGTQNYVASNPTGNEISLPCLTFNSLTNNVAAVTKPVPSFTVYPNPSSDKVTIEVNSTGISNSNSYSIYDMDGRILLKKKLGLISGTYIDALNISSLASGEYLIEFTFDGVASSKKIIKN